MAAGKSVPATHDLGVRRPIASGELDPSPGVHFSETTYHGGVMWLMPRAAREGRVGDSGRAFTDNVRSRMLETFSREEIRERVAKRLQDPDVAAWPNRVHVLNHLKNHEAWFDIVLNELDGEWYEELNDNGVMDEPAVSVFVEGSRERVTGDQWPPKDVEHRSLCLRPRRKLSAEPELMGTQHAAPDGFSQAP